MGTKRHDEYLRHYITSEKSPKGAWYLEFPIGFEHVNPNMEGNAQLRAVDAVCFGSRDDSLPASYLSPENQKLSEYHYRRCWETGQFEDQSATIIEAKTAGPSLKAVGQLATYEALLEDEWNLNVDRRILLVPTGDSILEQACDLLDVEVQWFQPELSSHMDRAHSPDHSKPEPAKTDLSEVSTDRPGPENIDELRERLGPFWDSYQSLELRRQQENLSVEEAWQRYGQDQGWMLSKEQWYTGERNP